jgi:hypothetical protein
MLDVHNHDAHGVQHRDCCRRLIHCATHCKRHPHADSICRASGSSPFKKEMSQTEALVAAEAGAPQEEWRRWPDHKQFEFSNLGRFRRNGDLLKGCVDRDGYVLVAINRRKCRVHRIIAQLFVEKQEHHTVVDHINRVKGDNRVANLRWASLRENSNNMPAYTRAQPAKIHKLDSNRRLVEEFDSVIDAQIKGPISRDHLLYAIKHKVMKKGFYWEHAQQSLPGELWKTCTSLKGVKVQVSNKGRIKTALCRIVMGSKRSGYLQFHGEMVHRMVCRAFLTKPHSNGQLIVNHKDCDKHNNAADNLEWITQSENAKHSVDFRKARRAAEQQA